MVNKEADETLLRAYQASYAALQNINFEDFKKQVTEKTAIMQSNAHQTPEMTKKKVEHFIDDFEWGEI